MVTNWTTALKEAGADSDGALRRLSGNISLYQKILRMFPQDETYKQIEPALQANDWAALLAAAHTLKGVAGNLGLIPLSNACSDTVTLLRAERYVEAVASCAKIRDAYTEFIEIIRLLEEA